LFFDIYGVVKFCFTYFGRNSLYIINSVKLLLLNIITAQSRPITTRNYFLITSRRSGKVNRSKEQIIFTICNQMSLRNRLKQNPDQGSFPESKVEKNQGKNVQNVPPPNIPSLNVAITKRIRPKNVSVAKR